VGEPRLELRNEELKYTLGEIGVPTRRSTALERQAFVSALSSQLNRSPELDGELCWL
jgi:hypothetical protein